MNHSPQGPEYRISRSPPRPWAACYPLSIPSYRRTAERGKTELTLESGQMLGHYRLVESVGEGGMGLVWKALDTKLNSHLSWRWELESDGELNDAQQFLLP